MYFKFVIFEVKLLIIDGRQGEDRIKPRLLELVANSFRNSLFVVLLIVEMKAAVAAFCRK